MGEGTTIRTHGRLRIPLKHLFSCGSHPQGANRLERVHYERKILETYRSHTVLEANHEGSAGHRVYCRLTFGREMYLGQDPHALILQSLPYPCRF